MKPVAKSLKLLYLTIAVCFVQAMAFAQDSATRTTTSTTKVEITNDAGNWFASNWLWVVGAIVFIILLFALIGGGSTRKTTIVREDGAGRVTRTTTVDEDI